MRIFKTRQKQNKQYAQTRNSIQIIITLLFIIAPHIVFDDYRLFLFDFDKKELELLFINFSTSELYLLPLLLIAFFLFIFIISAVGGRIWCSFACPQTIFRTIYRDYIQTKILKVRKSTKNRQVDSQKGIKRFVGAIFWMFFSFLISSNFMLLFNRKSVLINAYYAPQNHLVLISFIFIIACIIWYLTTTLKENFCAFVCPYARVQMIMSDQNTFMPIFDDKNNECISCNACIKVCPTHIDIKKGMQLECIHCLDCVDICGSMMGKLGKNNIIHWSSTNEIKTGKKASVFRARNVAYICLILALLLLATWLGSHSNEISFSINKTGALHVIKDDKVQNYYIAIIKNKGAKSKQIQLKINDIDVKIVKPKEMFALKHLNTKKKIIILETNKETKKSEIKDLELSVLDKERNVLITRKIKFNMP